MIAVAALITAPAASGSITVGSDLSLPASGRFENCILSMPPCTRLPFAFHQGNAFQPKSPANGQITSFGIKTAGPETVTFRLGVFPPSGGMKGTGTGPTVAVPGSGTFSFPANLPIKAGEIVGYDGGPSRAVSQQSSCGTGAGYVLLHPPMTNVAVDGDSTNACEVLVNAVITPSNKFKLSKVFLKVISGLATLVVDVPGPGELSLSGKGIAKRGASKAARTKKAVMQAGKTKLKFRPAAGVMAKLALSGSASLKARVTYAPTGGSASSQRRKLKLRA